MHVAERIDAAWDRIAHQLRHQHETGRIEPIIISPRTPETHQQEETPMPSLKELEGDAVALVEKFKQIDHAAAAKFDAVMANPEAAQVVSDLAGLVGIGVAPGVIAGFGRAIATALSLFVPTYQPAEPTATAGADTPAEQPDRQPLP